METKIDTVTFKIGSNTATLIHGDCLEVMTSLESKSIQMVTGGSDQVGSPSASLVTGGGDQAGTPAPRRVLRVLTPAQEQILRFCDVPQRQEAIMAKIGVTHRTHFRNHQLRPLLESGLLVQTHPENPTHPNQAYVVSPTALALLD